MGDTQVGTNGHAGTPYEDGRSNGSTRLTIEKSRQEERNTDGTLLYDWDGENDPRNPFNWSRLLKWRLTIAVLIVSILFGLPAGAYGAGNDEMSALFNVSNSGFPYLFFATTSWNVGAAVFPLLFVPLTETSGRMPGYFGAYIVFLIFLIPCGVAQNFETMVVCRFFGGGASSVAINIVGGTISDVWKGPQQRSLPLSLFGTTSVIGIALGPFVGGAITSTYLSFRWIYWVLLIITGGLLPVFWFLLVETRGDIILAREAKKWRKNNPDEEPRYAEAEIDMPSVATRLKVSFKRPVKMLCTEWVVFSQTLWVSFAWGLLFLFQSSVTQTFSTNYNYNTFQTSLIQLSLSVGAIIATFVNPIQDHLYLQSAKRSKTGTPIPEARLYSSIPGSLLFTAGLFCKLSDRFLRKYNASALSAASLGRNTFGAFLPLASPALFTNLGFQWASSLLGFVALVLSLAPVLLLVKGEEIRKRSPFMKEATFAREAPRATEDGV
ncbi:major facilitator superfamily transporter [Botrytis cinerea]